MLKKKVLLFGNFSGIGYFFISGYTMEYEIVAIVSDNAEMFYLTPQGNFPKIDVIARENVPDFVYKMVDAVLLVDKKNRQEDINFLLQRRVEPKKIIAWDMYGSVEVLSGQQNGENLTMMEGLEFHPRNVEDQNFIAQIRQMLRNQKVFFAFDPQVYPQMLANNFYQIFKRPLNWNHLATFAEKICWLKLFDATPLKTRLADKYLSRYFVAEKIGDDYLTPLLGVWDNAADIDFEFLPERFLLRCNHAPSFFAVVDKKNINVRELREKFTAMMQVDFSAQYTFELQYSKIRRKIFAEEILDGNVAEYKFLCFNGQPQFCRHANIYFDMDWNTAKFEQPTNIPKPKNFSAMKKLARKLCGDFAFVRVDFKEIGGRIYFDAFEFTPNESLAADKIFGDLLTLANTPPRLPSYNPADHIVLSKKYSPKLHFAHPERITFPKVEPCNGRVIASLTSWTKRISTAHLAIQTILAQSRPADLTVLYLAEEEFPNRERNLPPELLALRSDKFEIRWVERNIKSYKKLIPALKDFPDDIIINFDDDLYYHREIIERLLNGYKKYPSCIQCHCAVGMRYDDFGNFVKDLTVRGYDYPTYLNEINSGSGTLFPPHCFDETLNIEENFMKHAPTNDDIWFWLMAVLKGYRIHVLEDRIGNNTDFVPSTQEFSLWNLSNEGESYFTCIDSIFNAYPQLKEILWQEWQNAKPN